MTYYKRMVQVGADVASEIMGDRDRRTTSLMCQKKKLSIGHELILQEWRQIKENSLLKDLHCK